MYSISFTRTTRAGQERCVLKLTKGEERFVFAWRQGESLAGLKRQARCWATASVAGFDLIDAAVVSMELRRQGRRPVRSRYGN